MGTGLHCVLQRDCRVGRKRRERGPHDGRTGGMRAVRYRVAATGQGGLGALQPAASYHLQPDYGDVGVGIAICHAGHDQWARGW